MRADTFAGRLVAALARDTPAFDPAPAPTARRNRFLAALSRNSPVRRPVEEPPQPEPLAEFRVEVLHSEHPLVGTRHVQASVRVTAMAAAADVTLALWIPTLATVTYFLQVSPVPEDLTDERVIVDPRNGRYPTGSWRAAESRDYQVGIDVDPVGVNDVLLAARFRVLVGDQPVATGLIPVEWTAFTEFDLDELALDTRSTKTARIKPPPEPETPESSEPESAEPDSTEPE